MKIEHRTNDQGQKDRARDDLSKLLDAGVDAPPPCAANCPNAFSPNCSPSCPDVPRRLSSDPEKHPLEPLIAPLVYELQRLKVFQPCWSCEGHNGPDGALWKIPRVWFYCDGLIHVRALAGAIRQLELTHSLHASWQVVLVSLDQTDPDCCFSLEPGPVKPETALNELHADITTIATRLHDMMAKIAGGLVKAID
ncbi:hypothetical protein HBA54_11745 [Pelagibius litoralis]|uniref:Uncharacterized protein n=1 Tax=Pelagibius litoralis TaxID=374515 RepID=A0A967EXK4_9PROT|nr:hypothetical protein [Pelagibius litoralis]NIA69264.1 hypothetical protein [Pelagibius litoralis]